MTLYITKYYQMYNKNTNITRISFQPHSLTRVYVVCVDGEVSRVISSLCFFRNQDQEFKLYYGEETYYASGYRSTPYDVDGLREIFYRFNIPYTTSRMKMIKDLYTLELL